MGDVAKSVKQSGQFTDVEEEFFRQEQTFAAAKAAPVESFEDLDEGLEIPSPNFWQRLFRAKEEEGLKPKRPATQPGAQARPHGSSKPAGHAGQHKKHGSGAHQHGKKKRK